MVPITVKQYREEERTLIMHRKKAENVRYDALMKAMAGDTISSPHKIASLKKELANFHESKVFLDCETMGQLVNLHIQGCLQLIR